MVLAARFVGDLEVVRPSGSVLFQFTFFHMITIEAKFKPTPDDMDATGRAGALAALRKLKQVEELIADISDPDTGEHPSMKWELLDDGIKITYDGSDYVLGEMRRRVQELPE